jgi:tetratricopeptide (TPR) repeat protein
VINLFVFRKIEQVILTYFKPEEVSEIKKILLQTIDLTEMTFPEIDGKDKKSEKGFSLSQSRIDILITYAENRLSRNKLIEFLLILGETTKTLGHYQAAINVFNRLLDISDNEEKLSNIKINSYLAIADIYQRQAYWKESLSFIKKAKNAFEVIKDRKGIARCENLLGTLYGEQGDLKKALNHFEKSLSFLNTSKDSALIGMLEINLGIISNMQGNFDQAFTYFQRALVKFEQTQAINRISELRHNLGMLFTQKGEYDSALAEFDKSISLSVDAGLLSKLGISFLGKAVIFIQLKDYNLAAGFADKAMEICYKLNDRLSIADIYKVKGIIERHRGNLKLAENYLLTSLRINQELSNALNRAETLSELGFLYVNMGQNNKALENFLPALDYFQSINLSGMINKLKDAIQQIN